MNWMQRIKTAVGGWVGREKVRDNLASHDPTAGYIGAPFFAPEVVVNQLPVYQLRTGMVMVESDPVVEFAFSVRNAALMVADVEITAKNEQVRAWVQKQWDTIWNYHRSKIVQAKKWGFYGLQPKYREGEDGMLHVESFKDFTPWDIRPLEWNGEITGFEVKGQRLDSPQAVWMTFAGKWGNPYGSGLLKRMYPPWFEKWMERGAKKLGQLRMIKDAYIGDIFWYPPNMTVTLPNGLQVPWRDIMRQLAEQRMSGGALTLPMLRDDKGNELTKYQPPQDVTGGSQIFDWEDRLDKNILRGAGVPLETVEAQENGGFSGRSIPFMVILSSCTLEFSEIVDALVRQCLRPVAWLNFGGDPEFEIKPKSLVESFAQDAAGSPMGGSAIGGQPGRRPQEPAQQFAIDDKDKDGERWITLNGGDGEGTPVKIDSDGNIVKGPKGLADKGIKNLKDFGKDNTPTEEKKDDAPPKKAKEKKTKHEFARFMATLDGERYESSKAHWLARAEKIIRANPTTAEEVFAAVTGKTEKLDDWTAAKLQPIADFAQRHEVVDGDDPGPPAFAHNPKHLAALEKHGRTAVEGAKPKTFSVSGLTNGDNGDRDGTIHEINGKRYLQVERTARQYVTSEHLEDMGHYGKRSGGAYSWTGIEVEPTEKELKADAKKQEKADYAKRIEQAGDDIRKSENHSYDRPAGDWHKVTWDGNAAGGRGLSTDGKRLMYHTSHYDDGPSFWVAEHPMAAELLPAAKANSAAEAKARDEEKQRSRRNLQQHHINHVLDLGSDVVRYRNANNADVLLSVIRSGKRHSFLAKEDGTLDRLGDAEIDASTWTAEDKKPPAPEPKPPAVEKPKPTGVKTREVSTKYGKRHVASFAPSGKFWDLRKANKLPSAVSVSKNPRTGEWEAAVWGKTQAEVNDVWEKLKSLGLSPSVQFSVDDDAWIATQFDFDHVQFSIERLRAPVGGVTIHGKDYRGGQFIPAAVVAKMTEKEKQAVRDGKAKKPESKPGAPNKPEAKQSNTDQVMSALNGKYNQRIYLHELRKELPDLTREEQDAAFRELMQSGQMAPMVLDDPREFSAERSAGAIKNSIGQEMPIAYFKPPKDAPQPSPELAKAIKDAKPKAKPPVKDEMNGSWILRNKATGEVVMETQNPKHVAALNTDKYEAIPAKEYLQSLNEKTTADAPPAETPKPKKPKSPPKLPADKPVPKPVKKAVETKAAQAMRLAYEVMRSPHADYTDFRAALKDAWAHVKGQMTILYRDEDFATDAPKERRTIEAQEVMARLARMRGRKAVQMSADADTLTDEERDLLRLFAALELEDDDAEREEITREIVDLMGEMFEDGDDEAAKTESQQFDLVSDEVEDNEIAKAGAAAAIERVRRAVRNLSHDVKKKSMSSGAIESALRLLADGIGLELAASMQTAGLVGAGSVIASVPPAIIPPNVGAAAPPLPPLPPIVVAGSPGDLPEADFPILRDVLQVFKNAPVDTGRTFRETAEKARAGAFAVTGDLATEAVETLKTRLTEVFDRGGTEDDFAAVVQSLAEQGPLSEARLKVIFRTTVSTAMSEGQNRAANNWLVADAFPYRRYFATTDARVRHEHIALETAGLNGTSVYRSDDPVWREFEPPWDFGCRCHWTPYTVEMAARAGVQEAKDWLQRAKEAAGPDGNFHDYLSQTAPMQPQYVSHPPFHANPEFKKG